MKKFLIVIGAACSLTIWALDQESERPPSYRSLVALDDAAITPEMIKQAFSENDPRSIKRASDRFSQLGLDGQKKMAKIIEIDVLENAVHRHRKKERAKTLIAVAATGLTIIAWFSLTALSNSSAGMGVSFATGVLASLCFGATGYRLITIHCADTSTQEVIVKALEPFKKVARGESATVHDFA